MILNDPRYTILESAVAKCGRFGPSAETRLTGFPHFSLYPLGEISNRNIRICQVETS